MSNIVAKIQKIFLCHSSFDKIEVRKLYQRLISDGFDVWLDEEALLPGQDWENEIEKAIKQCDIVLICISSKSASNSGYLHKEIKSALDISDKKPDGALFIIPARLDECKIPERIQKWHSADLFTYRGYEKLLISLRKNEAQREKILDYVDEIETSIQYGNIDTIIPSLYVPIVHSKDNDKIPEQLTITLKSTGDLQKDKRRLRTVYGTAISYHGRDKFSFQISEGGRSYLIDFPNDTTRVCPELIERLIKLLGSEKEIMIEPLQY